ncbi:MAG: methyl-accepting chemotaxis protein [Methylocystaceae bacterium]
MDRNQELQKTFRPYVLFTLLFPGICDALVGALFCWWLGIEETRYWVYSIAVCGFGGFLIAGLMVKMNMKTFLNPIITIIKSVDDIAQGDLRVDLRDQRFGALDMMKSAIDNMGYSIRRMLLGLLGFGSVLNQSAANLDTGIQTTSIIASEVAQAISQIAQAGKSQASALDKMLTESNHIQQIAEYIASTTQEVVVGLRDAHHTVQDSISDITEQKARVQETSNTIDSINLSMNRLSDSSHEISIIMNVISGIAQQTNFLALNAAIEAARTGEGGRGFQVVSQEVRKLADESAQAAVQTSSLISDIRSSITKVASEVMVAGDAVRNQAEAIDDNREVLVAVTNNTEHIVQDMETLSTDIQSIVESINHINTMTHNLNQITQGTALGSSQVAATVNEQVSFMTNMQAVSGQIKIMAGEIQNHASRFVLPDNIKTETAPVTKAFSEEKLKRLGYRYVMNSIRFATVLAVVIFTPLLALASGNFDLGGLTKAFGLITVFGMLVTGTTAYINRIRFINPTGILIRQANAVAEGDLLNEIPQNLAMGHLGAMRNGFNQMILHLRATGTALNAICLKINEQAEAARTMAQETNHRALQIATTIDDMAQGTSNLATETVNASRQVKNMFMALEGVVNRATDLSNFSLRTETIVLDGVKNADLQNKRVTQTIEAANRVYDVASDLEAKANAIGQVVGVITTIAGETNLLALNAAIEAARAGAEGSGFAVVAGEVKKLADETLAAAQKIYRLIGSIQTETQQVVQDVNITRIAMEKQAQAVLFSEQVLEQVKAQVTPLNSETQNILAQCQIIYRATQSIDADIDSISSTSQETAASAQEVLAVTEEQERAIGQLQNQVDEFSNFANQLHKRLSLLKVS